MLPPVVCAPGGPATCECRAGPGRSHPEGVPIFAPPVPIFAALRPQLRGGVAVPPRSPRPREHLRSRRGPDGLAPRPDAELGQDRRDMVAGGLLGDMQAGGDL